MSNKTPGKAQLIVQAVTEVFFEGTLFEKAAIIALPTFFLGCVLSFTSQFMNPQTVEVDATSMTFSVQQNQYGGQQQLTEAMAPTGDFTVVATTPTGESAVFEVNNSVARWLGPQRRETFAKIIGARKNSVKNGCSMIAFDVTGLNYNLGVFRSYQIVKNVRSSCPTAK